MSDMYDDEEMMGDYSDIPSKEEELHKYIEELWEQETYGKSLGG